MCKAKLRPLLCLLSILLIVPFFSVTAFASGGDYVEEPLPEPTAEPGEPLSEETDIVTRDLLYDKATNKQFITIQDRDGNIFYLVIDYDAPVNGKEEQFKTYFLNPVDSADLAALAKDDQKKPPACICTEKCVPGKINMNCPVCVSNMSECMGKEPAPAEPESEPIPTVEQKPKKKPGVNLAVSVIVLLVLAGGCVFAFMKLKKGGKKTNTPNPDDYEDEDDLLYETEDETEAENDAEEAADEMAEETGGMEESEDETE